jgi:hypothetical protein
MSEVERTVTLVLSDRTERDYFPPHPPVNQQNGSTIVLIWEEEDGSVFSAAINTENIAALEMVTSREEQADEVLSLIEQVKAQDDAPRSE